MGDFYEPGELRRPAGPAEVLRFPPPRRRGRRLDSLWVPVVAFVVVALGGALALRADWGALRLMLTRPAGYAAATLTTASFRTCTHGLQGTCVVDGDTFRLRGEIIRIADIDTPEVLDFKCNSEKARGDRATARLVALLNAGPFQLLPIDRDTDVYGRSLRIVVRDGRSLGGVLVAEGLARQWDGARHPWC